MKKGKDFEELISWIHTCLAEKAKITPNAKISDKDSEELRQVDIAIYVTEGPYTSLTIVEVRDHKRPVGSGYIEEVKSKKDSVSADIAVVVSKSGFSKPAIDKAVRQNIRIMAYDEALQTSWARWAMMRTITTIKQIFEVQHINFEFDSPLDGDSAKDFSEMSKAPLKPFQVKFQIGEENVQPDINSLVKQMLDQNPSIWTSVEHSGLAVRRKLKISLNNQPPIRLIAGSSLIPVKALRVLLNLKIVEEEKPLSYSILRNMGNGSSVSDVLSAIVPYGAREAKLEIMTKGGSEVIEAGQKVFLRVVKL